MNQLHTYSIFLWCRENKSLNIARVWILREETEWNHRKMASLYFPFRSVGPDTYKSECNWPNFRLHFFVWCGSFLSYTNKGCRMFFSPGSEYSVGCLMDCAVPWSFSPYALEHSSLRRSTLTGKRQGGIFSVQQCTRVLFGSWTCKWRSLLVTSPWYNIFSSGVRFRSGTFSSWFTGPWPPPFQPMLTRSSLKYLPLALPTGLSFSLWWSQHSFLTSPTQHYRWGFFLCIIKWFYGSGMKDN